MAKTIMALARGRSSMETIKVYSMNVRSIEGKEDLLTLLPESRVKKAERCVRENDRLLSLAAGYLVYRYVGESFVDEYGKPRSKKIFFSLSHTEDVAAIALSRYRDVGVDVEGDRSREYDDLAEHCLNEEESAFFSRGEPFLSFFTAKESLAKAEGKGLNKRIEEIPALPLNGKVAYQGKTYYRHSFRQDGLFWSVTAEGTDFLIDVEETFVV